MRLGVREQGTRAGGVARAPCWTKAILRIGPICTGDALGRLFVARAGGRLGKHRGERAERGDVGGETDELRETRAPAVRLRHSRFARASDHRVPGLLSAPDAPLPAAAGGLPLRGEEGGSPAGALRSGRFALVATSRSIAAACTKAAFITERNSRSLLFGWLLSPFCFLRGRLIGLERVSPVSRFLTQDGSWGCADFGQALFPESDGLVLRCL